MSNVIQFRPRRRWAAGSAHLCPFCGDMDGFVNVGAQQWAVCDRHRVKWYMGANLTDDWLKEAQRDWTVNARYLANLDHIYPETPPHGERA